MAAGKLYTVEPLGDRTVLLTCRDELVAQQLANTIRQAHWQGIENLVVAYQSLAIHLDTRQESLSVWLHRLASLKPTPLELKPQLHIIPCCYELGEDLESVAKQLNIAPDKVVELHTSTVFTIYAIGFSPGFPYLGWQPKELQGIARRSEPRLKVPAGSVAIVGKQSAIYPQATPGGWALIGRTPLKIVDVAAGYFPLCVSDQVQFTAISRDAFTNFHPQ
jgi:KipI family sensor histidine kinase inhibitor